MQPTVHIAHSSRFNALDSPDPKACWLYRGGKRCFKLPIGDEAGEERSIFKSYMRADRKGEGIGGKGKSLRQRDSRRDCSHKSNRLPRVNGYPVRMGGGGPSSHLNDEATDCTEGSGGGSRGVVLRPTNSALAAWSSSRSCPISDCAAARASSETASPKRAVFSWEVARASSPFRYSMWSSNCLVVTVGFCVAQQNSTKACKGGGGV